MIRVIIEILLVFLVYVSTESVQSSRYRNIRDCDPNSDIIFQFDSHMRRADTQNSDTVQLRRCLSRSQKIRYLSLRKITKENLHLQQKDGFEKDYPCYHCLNEKMAELDLSINHLTVLTSKSFESLLELKILTLSYNWIRSIGNDVFSRTKKLRELDLSYNKLTSISSHYFGDIPEMRQLNLSFNSISKIDDDSFCGMKKLESLLLRGNKLESYNDACTGKRNPLSFVDLGRNNFQMFPYEMLYRIGVDYKGRSHSRKAVNKLNLDYNNITRLTNSAVFTEAFTRNIIVDLTGNDFCVTSAAITTHGLHVQDRRFILASCIPYQKEGSAYWYPNYLKSCKCDD